ncbi:DUF3426 domain-containing protein [Bordetella petrii]|uniref:DUF3426 domain-containing protein n=1 Tax=Bordetella petrii TaxID=94624 RepID=UPI001E5AC7DC|nr:DUF3426 domain-containing protein [Bordetella petrii]MCD0502149.1 DUF3426 domain-containing protein [Bordetella petrii]
MKKILACLLLAAASAIAAAQSMSHGVSIKDLAATRQADGVSVISGTLTNHSDKPVAAPSVTFVLYDAQGKEIGRAEGKRDTALAPGESWQVRAMTPLVFTRFTAMDIKAE